jgi:hypothetical protein
LTSTLVFWWGICLAIQSAERVFLVATTVSREPASAATLATTLGAGFRSDLGAAASAIVIAVVLGLVGGAGLAVARRWGIGREIVGSPWKRGIAVATVVVTLLLLILTAADMGYYGRTQQRLDLAALEAVAGVFVQTAVALGKSAGWALYVTAFACTMAAAIALWWFAFTRAVEPLLLALTLVAVGRGFGLESRLEAQDASIVSSTYYMLAQNPFWFICDRLEPEIDARVTGVQAELLRTIPEETAVRAVQAMVAPGGSFPSPRYPLVHATVDGPGLRLDGSDQGMRGGRRPNVLLIFAEGLDRRFLGATVRGIRLTPFLDRLRAESVYFEHFFSNGSSTLHGLLASLCSTLPRFGWSAIRTHYGGDFLCLPEALKRGGYRSEMVVGQSRNRRSSHLGLFMARNGLDEFRDEGNFAPAAPRNRLGILDGALFDLVRTRVEALQASDRPFLLATLTTTTHYPVEVPQGHPDVRALGEQPDRYVTAVRYLDLELERFFSGLRRDGLLRNTVVLILGDHGRSEKFGSTDAEIKVGNFLAPLFVWMDESLARPIGFRPRTVSMVASQVDLPPTILSLTGLMPALTPFVGQDLSCALTRDCREDNYAYLSGGSEHLIGLVDAGGVWMYRLHAREGVEMPLAVPGPSRARAVTEPDVAPRQQRLLSLYVTANLLIEQNRLWSTREFWDRR